MDITSKTLNFLEAAGLGRSMFSDVDPNPNEKNAAAGIEAYNSGGHDGVIAFGGGSGLDLGKLVAFMAGQTRSLWDFEDIGHRRRGTSRLAETIKHHARRLRKPVPAPIATVPPPSVTVR